MNRNQRAPKINIFIIITLNFTCGEITGSFSSRILFLSYLCSLRSTNISLFSHRNTFEPASCIEARFIAFRRCSSARFGLSCLIGIAGKGNSLCFRLCLLHLTKTPNNKQIEMKMYTHISWICNVLYASDIAVHTRYKRINNVRHTIRTVRNESV